MPAIVTNRIDRHRREKPHRVRLRITWPDDSKLEADSEEHSSRQSLLFVLQMQDADDTDAAGSWAEVSRHKTKAEAQASSDSVVGREVRSAEWQEEYPEGDDR